MTPKGIGLIRDSWAAVEPIADTAAGLFYGRLFELDPAIERLFRRTDMAGQRKVLMQTLTVVVKSLDKLDQIVPAVQALGQRHAGYGVREAHYATVARRSSGHSSKDSARRSRRRFAPRGRARTAQLRRS
jgi:hemoglobin-like flavoprotein